MWAVASGVRAPEDPVMSLLTYNSHHRLDLFLHSDAGLEPARTGHPEVAAEASTASPLCSRAICRIMSMGSYQTSIFSS